MGEKERATLERLLHAMDKLPEGKRQWLLGYAEGRGDALEEFNEARGQPEAGEEVTP